MDNSVDKQYKELLKHILTNGRIKKDRTGTGTISVFDYTMRFNMKEGFPILTSKKIFFKGVVHELIWFLKGETNIKYLVDNGVHIWDGDAYQAYLKNTPKQHIIGSDSDPMKKCMVWINKTDKQSGYPILERLSKEEFIEKIKTDNEFAEKWGELGPVYGQQWRNWKNYEEIGQHFSSKTLILEESDILRRKPIDQIQNLINDLKINPDDRGLIVSAWNVADLKNMALRPCHNFFQCYTYEMTEEERIKEWCESLSKNISYGDDMTWEKLDKLNFPKRKISLKWNQRSVDTFLGLGFNITSYSLLLHLLAQEVNMIPDELIFTGGDVHIYLNHIEQAKLQINLPTFKLPTIQISKKSIFDIEYDDIKLLGYKSGPAIKGELSN
jgi:thymidylate synthase